MHAIKTFSKYSHPFDDDDDETFIEAIIERIHMDYAVFLRRSAHTHTLPWVKPKTPQHKCIHMSTYLFLPVFCGYIVSPYISSTIVRFS